MCYFRSHGIHHHLLENTLVFFSKHQTSKATVYKSKKINALQSWFKKHNLSKSWVFGEWFLFLVYFWIVVCLSLDCFCHNLLSSTRWLHIETWLLPSKSHFDVADLACVPHGRNCQLRISSLIFSWCTNQKYVPSLKHLNKMAYPKNRRSFTSQPSIFRGE